MGVWEFRASGFQGFGFGVWGLGWRGFKGVQGGVYNLLVAPRKSLTQDPASGLQPNETRGAVGVQGLGLRVLGWFLKVRVSGFRCIWTYLTFGLHGLGSIGCVRLQRGRVLYAEQVLGEGASRFSE